MFLLSLTQRERNNLLRVALGLAPDSKLPEHGIDSRPIPCGSHLTVRLIPSGPAPERVPGRRVRRRMRHRILITCPCGQEFSAGRLGQHYRGRLHYLPEGAN